MPPDRAAGGGSQADREHETLDELWVTGRHGANSIRGFHYQDVVGAWLCGRVLSGDLSVARIVPEGLEDLAIEGAPNWHVQVKSRQERVRDFTAGKVAQFVADMASRHVRHEAAGAGGRLVLVLERPVAGEVFTRWGQSLSVLPPDHGVREALDAVAAQRGWDATEVARICDVTSLYVLPWHTAAEQTARAVAERYQLQPLAAGPVVLALRDQIAACADANAAAGWSDRSGLDRTRVQQVADRAVELVDHASLEEALAKGLCEAVDFDQPLVAASFYEGVDVQPGHVAAGLPVPRPEVTGQVVTALEEPVPVLITGPSGVGKSAVMWAAAYSTRHVLWYRVRQLRESDVPALVRLARASRPSARSPVGFVVDGVGVGTAEAWDALQRELAGVAHVLLLGSARTEDLLPLRTLPNCTVLRVELDELVAERIHARLAATGATRLPYWREAYQAAKGLTLEFTHLLTSGRRLSDVLTDQVHRRVHEGRSAELGILAVVSFAHRWGAELRLRAVQQHLEVGDSEFRMALARLSQEHLLRIRKEQLSGLHQLRSTVLSDAVHAAPPPTFTETLSAVLRIVEGAHLQRVVAGVLSERPDLDDTVLDQIASRLGQDANPAALVGALQALRLVDFQRQARAWAQSLDRHGVRPAHRQITIQLALSGGLATGVDWLPEIAEVLAEIGPTLNQGSPLRDALLARLGNDALAGRLSACGDSDTARQVLAVLADTSLAIAAPLAALESDTPLARLLARADAEELGDVLAAARGVSRPLAEHLARLAGGQQVILDRLRSSSPWLVEASVVERAGAYVAYARLLHVSDRAQPDFDRATTAFARTMLRCLPLCESADVQTLAPGSVPLGVGDAIFGVSRLERAYDRLPEQAAWTRLRSQVAMIVAQGVEVDATRRTYLALRIISDLRKYLDILCRELCVGPLQNREAAARDTLQHDLSDQAGQLAWPVEKLGLLAARTDEAVPATPVDSLSGLVTSVVSNLTTRLAQPDQWQSLVGFVGETLRDAVRRVRQEEQWDVVDQSPPADLDSIDRTLHDLSTVLAELVWGGPEPSLLMQPGRSGPHRLALARVADRARASAADRAQRRQRALKSAAAQAGLTAVVHQRPLAHTDACFWPPVETAIGVELDDLTEWEAALEILQQLLSYTPAAEGARMPVLLYPLISGRPVRPLARSLISDLWPGMELFDTWSTQLPRAWPTSLTNAALEGYRALHALSGVAVLASRREVGTAHQEYAQEEANSFQAALQTAVELAQTDPVAHSIVLELLELGERVQQEIHEAAADGEDSTLAAQLMLGHHGVPTADFAAYGELIGACLVWDLEAATREGNQTPS